MSLFSIRPPVRKVLFLGILLLFSSGFILFSILIPDYSNLLSPSFKEGDVASQDIVAPSSLTYDSQILTADWQKKAADSVLSIYTPLDTSIARRQLDRLHSALAFITSIRADGFSSTEQKLTDISALEDIRLSHDSALKIITLSDSRWEVVQQETISTLEQVMRSTIRDDQLDQARRGVPVLVSLSLPEDQAAVVAELVTAFVTPNSFYDDAKTQEARTQAMNSVQAITRSYVAGETIVQHGQLITPDIYEALVKYGMAAPHEHWQNWVSASLLTVFVIAFMVIYLRRNSRLLQDLRGLAVFLFLFTVFLVTARLIIPGHTILPYLYPTMAFSLTVAALFGRELAFISTIPLAILIAYGLPNALDLTLFAILSSYFGVLTLRHVQRVMAFFSSGAAIAISGMAILLLYRLPQPGTDIIGLLTLSGAAVLNGLASAGISVILQFFIAQALGLTTALQLIDLSRPDHPLLQFILRNAPGTYQHSLQVSNLAEQAAERIGADALLTRVGSLYHDAGKALNPFFFIENQPQEDINPHDDLDPEVSAAIIICHVQDGLELAQKYRLPGRIRDFIREHHGTMVTSYQYVQAVEAAGGDASLVDITRFRYAGPRPQTRETALIMLADGCEARVRSGRPRDESELRKLIQEVVDDRVRKGELNDTDLTLRDLDMIVDSFVATLRGVFHPRIEYPRLETPSLPGREIPTQPAQLLPGREAPSDKPVEET